MMVQKNVVILFLVFSLSLANDVSLKEFHSGNKLFTASVYKELAKQDDNFLVCPFSAETVLALAQSGAKDETGEEIRNALKLPNNAGQVEAIFRTLIPKVLKRRKPYSFHTANKIYVRKDFPIRNMFMKIAYDIYRCKSENIDFTDKTKAAKSINKWVEKQTENKIHDLIKEESLSDKTLVILINALYFKAAWKSPFKKSATQKKDFHRTLEDVIQVNTMQKSDYFDYYEDAELDVQFLRLPFKNNKKTEMVFVLPKKKDGLAVAEEQLENLLITPNYTSQFVYVALPTFKIESSIDFKQIMQNLGMKRAFKQADFSEIAGEKGDIFISEILQKTFISVNEDGVEATASTSVNFAARSFIQHTGEKKQFIADHPFLFYIKVKNTIIFAGRIISPSLV